MNKSQSLASVYLRLALAAGFLSAVASRLGFWGNKSSGWQGFLEYAAQVNSFAPKSIIPAIAIVSTVLETLFGVLLLIGYKTKLAAYGACILTLLFALAMAYSFGIKEPFDYSVFACSAGGLLLATFSNYTYSIDALIKK